MKPDKDACMKMAKDAGMEMHGPHGTFYVRIIELERLIHAAWDAAEKETAREARKMLRQKARVTIYAPVQTHCETMADAITERFNLEN